MISKEEAKKIASLSRIYLHDLEAEHLAKDLEAILNYVNQLNELTIKDVAPTSHVLPLKNVFRSDVVKPSLEQKDAMKFAVQQQDGMYKVPKVIE